MLTFSVPVASNDSDSPCGHNECRLPLVRELCMPIPGPACTLCPVLGILGLPVCVSRLALQSNVYHDVNASSAATLRLATNAAVAVHVRLWSPGANRKLNRTTMTRSLQLHQRCRPGLAVSGRFVGDWYRLDR